MGAIRLKHWDNSDSLLCALVLSDSYHVDVWRYLKRWDNSTVLENLFLSDNQLMGAIPESIGTTRSNCKRCGQWWQRLDGD